MKIKKMYQGTAPENKILNTHSNSQTDVYSCDYINKLNNYSTEEQIIGTWTDGKSVYKKTIETTCGQLQDELNNLNIKLLIDVKGNAWTQYDHIMFINAPNPEPHAYVFGVYQNLTNLDVAVFYNSAYLDSNKVICTVEYTKTTD